MGLYLRAEGAWWCSYTVDGVRYRESLQVRSKAQARAKFAELKRKIAAGIWTPPAARKSEQVARRGSFAEYALDVVERRIARGVKTAAGNERGHVRNHLIPAFGRLSVSDLARFKAVQAAFAPILDKPIEPATIRNIHSTLRLIMVEAVEEGLLDALPPPLSVQRGHRPSPKRSSKFRPHEAVFDRREVRTLLACDRVPAFRRARYAALFAAGMRFGELADLRVGDYDPDTPDLGTLIITAEKVDREVEHWRVIPVHPDLAPWIDAWLGAYELHTGRPPEPDAPLFPAVGPRNRRAGLAPKLTQPPAWRDWSADLVAAGLRHRRMHDTRRSFVSWARSSRIDVDAVRSITHRAVADRVIDAYTAWEHDAMVAAVRGIRLDLPPPPRDWGM